VADVVEAVEADLVTAGDHRLHQVGVLDRPPRLDEKGRSCPPVREGGKDAWGPDAVGTVIEGEGDPADDVNAPFSCP
jgi:hypothetical protein